MKASSWGPGGSSGRRPSCPAPWHCASWLQHGGPEEADDKCSETVVHGRLCPTELDRETAAGWKDHFPEPQPGFIPMAQLDLCCLMAQQRPFYSFYKPVWEDGGNGRTGDGFEKLEGSIGGTAAAPPLNWLLQLAEGW